VAPSVRRFGLEDSFRSVKQTLEWTVLQVPHSEQTALWSGLMLAAVTQLRVSCSSPFVTLLRKMLPETRRNPAGALQGSSKVALRVEQEPPSTSKGCLRRNSKVSETSCDIL
jgi:hypothetical protein